MIALIVDDESRVRKAVRLLVDWGSHGITEIMEAGSGSEAIELIRSHRPMLVIMDMMMDFGSGLELMAWVSEHAGSTKFIVVSGHDDFDFVRNAVRHGGIDYILKPIEPEAINTAVAKAVAAWKEEEEERSTLRQQNIALNEIKPVYGERLLSALIDDSANAEASLRRLRREGIIPDRVQASRLLVLQTDPENHSLLKRFGKDRELLLYAVLNICNDFLQTGRTGIAFRYWGTPWEIVIMLWDEQADVPELVENINAGLFQTLQCRMHFGISRPGNLPMDLKSQLTEAASALQRRNLLHTEQYCHFAPGAAVAPLPSRNGSYTATSFADVEEEWDVAVKSGRSELMSQAAGHWVDLLSRSGGVTPEMLNVWKTDILHFRTRIVRETLGDQSEEALASLEQADKAAPSPPVIGYSFSMYAWRDWSFSLMQNLAEKLAAKGAAESGVMGDIVKYLEQNYQTDLSLQEVAGKFFVSREYVSRRFKQEFGINFTDYIGNYRIDKSKLLMQNPHLTLSQISEMVGFHDVKYFSKVFKKREGITPKEYRSSLEV
ncbi:response regulator [Paenibacillus sp. HN-1]|uniref:response regulator transcription factor n=1 Tax=Paenibacillus TaxID=44249 RepID=UPI001CA93235|nr:MULTISPECIES: response regulator [Paenibacillus]MBY9078543.1 response regulator [Paenibacillus sp. CGMCC 1.18879]MBY9082717.1 response regulator [Paenibacillus sinensis]